MRFKSHFVRHGMVCVSSHFSNSFCLGLLALVWLSLMCPVAHASTQAHFGGVQTTIASGLDNPRGVAADQSGNVFVANSGLSEIEEIPAGCRSSSCMVILGGGFSGAAGVAVDGSGNVFVADSGNAKVKEIPSGCFNSGCVVTLGGGYSFGEPSGVAPDANGNVYVADYSGGKVEEILAAGGYTTVNVIGGGFVTPDAVAVDGSGNVFISDVGNGTVSEIPPGCVDASCVVPLASSFTFSSPRGLALDASGNLYVSDAGLNAAEEILASGGSYNTVKTLNSSFSSPRGIALDGSGNVYIGDFGNNAVEELSLASVNFGSVNVASPSAAATLFFVFDSAGTIDAPVVVTQGATGLDFADATTGTCNMNVGSQSYNPGNSCTVNVAFTPQFAGTRYGAVLLEDGSGNVISTGYVSGSGVGPQVVFLPSVLTTLGSGLSDPHGLVLDASGNIYVADTGANEIVELLAPAYTTQLALGGGFNQPRGVAVDGRGNVFVGDGGNAMVKEIPYGCAAAACVVTLGGGFSFEMPYGVAVDGSGNVFVNDYTASKVYEILAGGYTTVQQIASSSTFADPYGIAVDGNSNVFIADEGNSAVREILAAGGYTTVETLGSGFSSPRDVAVDGSGNVYVADGGNLALKEILAPGGYTTVETLGSGYTSTPEGVAVDGAGDIFFAFSGGTTVGEQGYSGAPTLTFPTTTSVGTQDTADGPMTVTLLNNGNANLSFAVPGSGTNPSISGGFTIDGSSTCPQISSNGTAGTLAPGANCTYAVDFEPTINGSNPGSLIVTDNNMNTTPDMQTIPLLGTAPGATITVFPTTATLTAGQTGSPYSQTFTASGGNGPYTYTYTGSLPPGLTLSSAGTLAGTPTASSTFQFTVTATDSNSYFGSSVQYSLTISQEMPTISNWPTATAITYGQTLASSTLSGGSPSVGGSFAFTNPTTAPTAGTAAQSVTFTPADTTDYASVSGSVNVTVNKATPLITWAAPAAITYGTALSATQLDATASVPGTFAYSPAAGAVLAAGAQTLSVTFTPTDTADYTNATAHVSLTVNAAAGNPAPVITGMSPAVVQEGSPAFTVTVTGSNFGQGATVLWNGSGRSTTWVSATELTASITAADVASQNTAEVSVANPASLGGATSPNFEFAIDTPTGTPGFFAIGSTSTTLNVQPGQNTQIPVTFTGTTSGAAITAACVNVPTGVSCSYSNGVVTITPSATAAAGTYTTTVIFTAVQQTAAAIHHGHLYLAAWFAFGSLPLGFFWMGGNRKKAVGRYAILLSGTLLITLLMLLAGCGNGGQASSPSTSTSTKTQTSMALTLTIS